MESFTILEKEEKKNFRLFDDVLHFESAPSADHDLQYVNALRREYPDKVVTVIPQVSANIIAYAHAGYAEVELDTSSDAYASWKGYVIPQVRSEPAALGEATFFAKYHLDWKGKKFIMYYVHIGFSGVQYLITDKEKGETIFGPSAITDKLIMDAGDWQNSDTEVVWVYDMGWRRDKELFKSIKKATWDKVILDEGQKKELVSVSNTFFSSKKTYEDLGVPWKRGLLFHGPPGNGKTVSIKALMHTLLLDRGEDPIPTLYVKAAPYTWMIGAVFAQARRLAPCMLVLEDVETIVTPQTRSYFFNEMDGLANNDGIFVVASTNYLDRLDPGLTKRPSRFDRKYLFPLPNEHERTLYCQFWQRKVASNPKVDFPNKLCPAMAHITPAFSFAFLQECFVATMLSLARMDDEFIFDEDDDLDDYDVWRAFKAQADILRKEIRDYDSEMASSQESLSRPEELQRQQVLPYRGINKETGAPVQFGADVSPMVPLQFNARKQPELNTGVYNWVAPRGYVGQV